LKPAHCLASGNKVNLVMMDWPCFSGLAQVARKLEIMFTSMHGAARQPIAHKCSNTLEMLQLTRQLKMLTDLFGMLGYIDATKQRECQQILNSCQE